MNSRGGFAWRWVIAVMALAVIAVTLFVPPPGPSSGTTDGDVTGDDRVDTYIDTNVQQTAIVPDTIRILVLNGTEMPNLAGRTQIQLIAPVEGDTVVVTAPWDPSNTETKPFPETVVISHLADRSAAGMIAGRMGLTDSSIVWEVPVVPDLSGPDVTVCIGDDYAGHGND